MAPKITFRFNRPAGPGWQECCLRNPEAVLTGDLTLPPEAIVRFFQHHRGKYIAGFISYDYGRRLLKVPGTQPHLVNIPSLMFAAYSGCSEVNAEPATGPAPQPVFTPLLAREDYIRSVDKILNHIRQGDFYQVNFTHFLKAAWERGTGARLYHDLLRRNSVRYAAYLETEDYSVLSFSPECFLRFRGKSVITEPIKGTVARKPASRGEEQALLASAKEKAELDMITDLLRNDLGKICEPGSVRIIRHRAIMKLEKLWHTYTAIEGRLLTSSPISAVLSCLPGGSISGCPKKRAVEAIRDLEPYARGIYTGTMGVQYPNGDSDWSVMIRTIIKQNDALFLGVGGGITVDSRPAAEYDESLAKARSLGEIQPC